MKKKIGISFTKTNFQHYWNWITPQDLQDDLELVELSFEKDNTADIYTCDGFILTGGVDVHPDFYKGDGEYKNRPQYHQLDRDYFEEKIYRYAQINTLPLLAICRGMQLVNVLQGGKLIQDLENGNERHRKEKNFSFSVEAIICFLFAIAIAFLIKTVFEKIKISEKNERKLSKNQVGSKQ